MTDLPASLLQLSRQLTDPELTNALVASRPRRGGRQAAVLILLGEVEGELEVVLIEKTPHLRKHAGQVAFPGGGVEYADASFVAAALREAEEEAGIRPETVRVLGTLPPAHVLASGFDVIGVVGHWRRPESLRPADTREVAAVHQVRISTLVDPAVRSTAVHPSGFRGPAFEVHGLFIWGFTAYLLDGLLDLAGWSVPWDAGRLSTIPDRFLHGRR